MLVIWLCMTSRILLCGHMHHRSSKERSMFPKIDIAKEREERDLFTAETGDYAPTSVVPTSSTDDVGSISQPTKTSQKVNQNTILRHSPSEAREVAQDKDNRHVGLRRGLEWSGGME